MKKMRKLVCILSSIALLLFTIPPSSFTISAETHSGSCGANVSWSFDTATGDLLISGQGDMENLDTYTDIPWYSYRGSIDSVVISNGVTSISNSAFRNCSNLKSITVPGSVNTIGSYAFSNCSGLTSITITNGVKNIGDWVFRYCTGLTSIKIPNSVTKIGNYAFYACDSLSSIIIPNGVTSIGNSTFSGCNNLIMTVAENSYAHTYAIEKNISYVFCTHTNTKTVNVVAATCTADGYSGDIYCRDCDKLINKGNVISSSGHNYNEEVIVPSCTEQGYTSHTCLNCGNSYIDTYVSELEHSYATDVVEATCTTPGYTVYKCENYDDSYVTNLVDAYGHNLDSNNIYVLDAV